MSMMSCDIYTYYIYILYFVKQYIYILYIHTIQYKYILYIHTIYTSYKYIYVLYIHHVNDVMHIYPFMYIHTCIDTCIYMQSIDREHRAGIHMYSFIYTHM